MKVFIAGGLGFVGRNLSNFLLNKGHMVTAVGTRKSPKLIDHKNFRYISANTTMKGKWQEELKDIDAVINLAGVSLIRRWTKSLKKLIYDSRILTTRNLVEALPSNREILLCSTSAVGYYGNRGEDILNEDEPPGNDFLAVVAKDWEKEAFVAVEKGIRVVAARFGIVLGRGGGILEKMIPAFRFFAGGPLGDGMQWFSWIHMDDLLSAIMFIMDNQEINGSVNLCSPHPVRNKDLAKTLGHILNRSAFMPAPAFMIRLIMGEFGESILYSQRMVPDKLLSYRFAFQYPDIKDALGNLVKE